MKSRIGLAALVTVSGALMTFIFGFTSLPLLIVSLFDKNQEVVLVFGALEMGISAGLLITFISRLFIKYSNDLPEIVKRKELSLQLLIILSFLASGYGVYAAYFLGYVAWFVPILHVFLWTTLVLLASKSE